jgi:uncharacterized damage-inducible protein DinB
MNKEIQSIIRSLNNINYGEPWYGRSVFFLMDEADPAKAYEKPGRSAHSLAELLYHMLTWADFTLNCIKENKEMDVSFFETNDWREIDPAVHTWKTGLEEYKKIHEKIVELLKQKDNEFLDQKVNHRNYNFRFLLNGLIQHNIYHAGQIAYLKKLLD